MRTAQPNPKIQQCGHDSHAKRFKEGEAVLMHRQYGLSEDKEDGKELSSVYGNTLGGISRAFKPCRCELPGELYNIRNCMTLLVGLLYIPDFRPC